MLVEADQGHSILTDSYQVQGHSLQPLYYTMNLSQYGASRVSVPPASRGRALWKDVEPSRSLITSWVTFNIVRG